VDDVCLTIEGGESLAFRTKRRREDDHVLSLVGLIRPDTGVVKLDGVDITAVPVSAGASWNRLFARTLGVPRVNRRGEHFGGSRTSVSLRRERQEKVDELLDEFGLAAIANSSPPHCLGNGDESKSPVP
jgi:ABC-type lipopolysaccharide export system ATPase subunit